MMMMMMMVGEWMRVQEERVIYRPKKREITAKIGSPWCPPVRDDGQHSETQELSVSHVPLGAKTGTARCAQSEAWGIVESDSLYPQPFSCMTCKISLGSANLARWSTGWSMSLSTRSISSHRFRYRQGSLDSPQSLPDFSVPPVLLLLPSSTWAIPHFWSMGLLIHYPARMRSA